MDRCPIAPQGAPQERFITSIVCTKFQTNTLTISQLILSHTILIKNLTILQLILNNTILTNIKFGSDGHGLRFLYPLELVSFAIKNLTILQLILNTTILTNIKFGSDGHATTMTIMKNPCGAIGHLASRRLSGPMPYCPAGSSA